MTSAQPRVNTNKQLAPRQKNYFSHSLTHLASYFSRAHTRIQMGNHTRRERFGHEALFAMLKSPFPAQQDTIELRSRKFASPPESICGASRMFQGNRAATL